MRSCFWFHEFITPSSKSWSWLFEDWIMLYTWQIFIHWIAQCILFLLICWIAIHPLGSIICPLYNWAQEEQRVFYVETGWFTPLLFGINGGMGSEHSSPLRYCIYIGTHMCNGLRTPFYKIEDFINDCQALPTSNFRTLCHVINPVRRLSDNCVWFHARYNLFLGFCQRRVIWPAYVDDDSAQFCET